MRHIAFSLLLACSACALTAAAAPLDLARFASQRDNGNEQLERKSQSVLTYLWIEVYAAAFYAPPAISVRQAVAQMRDQRLELYYLHAIDRRDVIKAANTTLQRQQEPARLARLQNDVQRLHTSLQNIRVGDRYALDYRNGRGLDLERNGQVIFSSANPELANAYLAIWLGPDGLSPTLREALLGPP